MQKSGWPKTAVAFLSGIVLALGAAALYTRVTNLRQAPVHAALAEITPATQSTPKELPKADRAQAPTKQTAALPVVTPSEPRRPAAVTQVEPRHRVQHTPEVAQNEPPSPYPAPSATVATDSGTAESSPGPAAPASDAPDQAPPAPEAPIAPITPVPRQPRTVTIPSGTSIAIRLQRGLSSEHNAQGDAFGGTLDRSIVLDNAIIAERGSHVTGQVVELTPGSRGERAASLAIALTGIETTDGQHIRIQTSSYQQHGGAKNDKAAKIGGGAALGAIIGAIAGGGRGAAIGAGVGGAAGGGDVLLTRGKPAVIEDESRLSFQLAQPVTITEQLH